MAITFSPAFLYVLGEMVIEMPHQENWNYLGNVDRVVSFLMIFAVMLLKTHKRAEMTYYVWMSKYFFFFLFGLSQLCMPNVLIYSLLVQHSFSQLQLNVLH